jgi:hypothetical protein
MNMEGDDGPEEETGGAGAAGAIEKALAKRGTPSSKSEEPPEEVPATTKVPKAKPATSTTPVVTPGEAGAEGHREPALMLSGLKKATSTLVEKMDAQDKLSDKRTDELLSRLSELRQTLDYMKK